MTFYPKDFIFEPVLVLRSSNITFNLKEILV